MTHGNGPYNFKMNTSTLTPAELAGMIDHTFLKPFGMVSDIEKLCCEAREYGFAMVAINPAEVRNCVRLLAGSPVRVGAAIGFPLGQNTVEIKFAETRDAIGNGATEIDTVINIRALQSGHPDVVRCEISDMVNLWAPQSKTVYDQQQITNCQLYEN